MVPLEVQILQSYLVRISVKGTSKALPQEMFGGSSTYSQGIWMSRDVWNEIIWWDGFGFIDVSLILNWNLSKCASPTIHSFQNLQFQMYLAWYVGVSKNSGTPKWMGKITENPMNKWMIWVVFPYFLETPMYLFRVASPSSPKHLSTRCLGKFAETPASPIGV